MKRRKSNYLNFSFVKILMQIPLQKMAIDLLDGIPILIELVPLI